VVKDAMADEIKAFIGNNHGRLAWIFTPSRELTLRTVFVSGG